MCELRPTTDTWMRLCTKSIQGAENYYFVLINSLSKAIRWQRSAHRYNPLIFSHVCNIITIYNVKIKTVSSIEQYTQIVSILWLSYFFETKVGPLKEYSYNITRQQNRIFTASVSLYVLLLVKSDYTYTKEKRQRLYLS